MYVYIIPSEANAPYFLPAGLHLGPRGSNSYDHALVRSLGASPTTAGRPLPEVTRCAEHFRSCGDGSAGGSCAGLTRVRRPPPLPLRLSQTLLARLDLVWPAWALRPRGRGSR